MKTSYTFLVVLLALFGSACATKLPVTEEMPVRDQIQHSIKNRRSHFQLCYQQQLRVAPKSGKMMFSFEVGLDGRIGAIQILNDEISDPIFRQCIIDNLAAIQLPPQKEVQRVSKYPFVFKEE